MIADPFAVLGVASGATAEELATARRRKALEVHPDLGGTEAAMQELNAAYELALELLSARVADASTAAGTSSARSVQRDGRRMRGVRSDMPSFTIDVLPAEAHEALLVVTTWIGEVLVDDPPYLLEVFLREPSPCWCRLDLVPDAGATTVSLVVAGFDDGPTPDPEHVRDVWVANLNRLGDLG